MQREHSVGIIREILSEEYDLLGKLMVEVYSQLEGFPKEDEQPKYYEMLQNIGRFNEQEDMQVLIALSRTGELAGGIVYISNMKKYGAGGKAIQVRNSSGIRLLGVNQKFRGRGIGKALTIACINLTRKHIHSQVILHTTQAMQVAWGLYDRLGFTRAPELDFFQNELPVFGFKLNKLEQRVM